LAGWRVGFSQAPQAPKHPIYAFLAAFPGFNLIYSSKYLIPFHLYGSGIFNALILEATCPKYCLSIDHNVIIYVPLASCSTLKVIMDGIGNFTLCEKPRVKRRESHSFLAVYHTHITNNFFSYP
jgi:hypothetical protein